MQGVSVKRWIQAFTIFSLMTFFLAAFAHEETKPLRINENAPKTYVVKKGDTLWDIACQYLEDPWRWKEIWRANSDIENPHLIYPGDRLSLRYVGGKPILSLERRVYPHQRSTEQRGGVVKLHPRMRVLPAEHAIPTIPLHVIEPFFNESRVVSPLQAKHCPKIVALEEDHLVVGTGDHIYVSGLSPRVTETIFTIFRADKEYIHPKTKELLGVEGLNLGKAQLVQFGHPARLRIMHSYAETIAGDQITSTAHDKIEPFFIPKYPTGNANGYIISVFDGLNQISQYQILVITGGKNQCRQVGDVLAIYQTQKDLPSKLSSEERPTYRFPPIHVGRCVVFRVFDKVSYVLVMNATRPIYLLDEVTRP